MFHLNWTVFLQFLVGCSVSILVMARAGQLGAVFLVSGAVGNLVDRFYVGGAARRIGEFMCYSCDFHVIFMSFTFQLLWNGLFCNDLPRDWCVGLGADTWSRFGILSGSICVLLSTGGALVGLSSLQGHWLLLTTAEGNREHFLFLELVGPLHRFRRDLPVTCLKLVQSWGVAPCGNLCCNGLSSSLEQAAIRVEIRHDMTW